MRKFSALLFTLLGLAASSSAQTCTGLCLQQVSCPAGGTTTITGTVFTPNGTDPLPNVIVYIPNAPVDAFTPGVSCPVVGTPPSGSPLVGTSTAVDGTFTLSNVPVGTNIPLVIQSGRWRRQVVVPTTTACAATSFTTRMPKNQGEGEIPRFAIATGSADQVECVLRKVGVEDSEFTDPSGKGRINLYSSSGAPGARIGPATPSADVLMGDPAVLNQYDVLMLPCEGGRFNKPSAQLANIVQFANSGGRVYSSHFSYVWMYQNPPFNGVVNWAVNQARPPDGIATVDTTFADGQTLAQWLQLVGATTTPGQMAISTLRHDFNGVVAPTQSWLRLNNPGFGNPVQQFVFNAPVGTVANQCGRVLFNEYHVEDPPTSPTDKVFPSECSLTAPMTPQEKLLEFSLFELTNDGGTATLTPPTADFGSQPVGFPTVAQSFQWTNKSTFPASVTLLNTTGDFSVIGNNCSTVPGGASCNIQVVFNPITVGPRTGVLTVSSIGTTLTSTLTGIGTPDLAFSVANIDFGSLDVGASASKVLTVTSQASGLVSIPGFLTTGDYSSTTTCPGFLPGNGTCTITVTFKPTTTGTRTGTLNVLTTNFNYTRTPIALSGNGIDFSLASSPGSGSVIAGYGVSTSVVTTPIAGFSSAVSLTCTTNAPGSLCSVAAKQFTPTAAVTSAVSITTTSQYTVVGYGGLGGSGFLSLFGIATGLLLFLRRRSVLRSGPATRQVRAGVLLVFLATAGLTFTGCSGKLPATNANYTPPGDYSYTIVATDGFLTHSTTYALHVTKN